MFIIFCLQNVMSYQNWGMLKIFAMNHNFVRIKLEEEVAEMMKEKIESESKCVCGRFMDISDERRRQIMKTITTTLEEGSDSDDDSDDDQPPEVQSPPSTTAACQKPHTM